jgi:glycosyltransferase involved in cell wall biosynthesis
MAPNPVTALLINDLDPAESKGAASIALDLASRIFQSHDFAYLCTSSVADSPKKGPHFRFEFLKESSLDGIRDKLRNRFPALEGIMRVFAIRRLWRIFLTTRKLSPKFIWVHQIGWRIPITSLLVFRALRIPVYFTIHDYTFLRFRKLYPHDFQPNFKSVEEQLIKYHMQRIPLNLQLKSSENIWHRINRLIISKTSTVIYVSDLQSSIYRSAGYPTGTVVNNTVKPCNCIEAAFNLIESEDNLNILFAGRFIGKGLERVVDSISKSNKVHLHLAGGIDLLEYVQSKLPSHQFTYHNFLNEKQLHKLIHSVDLTVVASACFDVFPTMTLESLAHGTLVVSTPTAGNFNLVMNIEKSLGLPLSGSISFETLRGIVQSPRSYVNLDRVKSYVSGDSAENAYRSLFLNTSRLVL